MGKNDKIKNKIDENVGAAKEAVGKATGNDELRVKGNAKKNKAKVKDKVQDAVKKTKDAIKKK